MTQLKPGSPHPAWPQRQQKLPQFLLQPPLNTTLSTSPPDERLLRKPDTDHANLSIRVHRKLTLNGINPEAYLRHILSLLPEWPANRVSELLPWNVDLTTK
ncbi:transposase domain-containing protein [Salmonella enterica]|nr:transposase domain-containing protein [Salmonella enterica]ELV0714590.1 transposase domain-containing protein [Salmonella enterica]